LVEPQNRGKSCCADTLEWRSTEARSDCGTTRAPRDDYPDTAPQTFRTYLAHRARGQTGSVGEAHYSLALTSASRGYLLSEGFQNALPDIQERSKGASSCEVPQKPPASADRFAAERVL